MTETVFQTNFSDRDDHKKGQNRLLLQTDLTRGLEAKSTPWAPLCT